MLYVPETNTLVNESSEYQIKRILSIQCFSARIPILHHLKVRLHLQNKVNGHFCFYIYSVKYMKNRWKYVRKIDIISKFSISLSKSLKYRKWKFPHRCASKGSTTAAADQIWWQSERSRHRSPHAAQKPRVGYTYWRRVARYWRSLNQLLVFIEHCMWKGV